MTPRGGALVSLAVSVAAVTATVGTLAVAAQLIWLTALAWSGTGAAGGVAATVAWPRPAPPPPPVMAYVLRSSAPPALVTCAHYRLIVPFCTDAQCEACGPAEVTHLPAQGDGLMGKGVL